MKVQPTAFLFFVLTVIYHAHATVLNSKDATTNTPDEDGLNMACPVLSSELFDSPTESTPDRTSVIAQCSDSTCLSYLSLSTRKAVDCDANGVAIDCARHAILQLCQQLLSNSLTDDHFKKAFGDIARNAQQLQRGRQETVNNRALSATAPRTEPPPDDSFVMSHFLDIALIVAAVIVGVFVLAKRLKWCRQSRDVEQETPRFEQC